MREEVRIRKRLYSSRRWRLFRRQWLGQHPVCVLCGGLASVVDHVHGHDDDWREHFWSGPFQSTCVACNSRKAMVGAESFINGNQQRRRTRSGDVLTATPAKSAAEALIIRLKSRDG